MPFYLLAGAGAIMLAALAAFVWRLGTLSRRAKMDIETSPITKATGRAETDIAPEGVVFLRGVLWPAYSERGIGKGETVRVTGLRGLALEVEKEELSRRGTGAQRFI